MNIDLIPDLNKYPHIVNAWKNEKLIIFIGAGVSALWGCKRWREMAITLIDSCYEKSKIDYWTRKNLILKYSTSPRKLITISKNILGEEYLYALKKTLCPLIERKDRLPNLFDNLYSLNSICITTNIDDHLSNLFDANNVHIDLSGFKHSLFKPRHIFHLHGVIRNTESLVLTIDEYVKRYQDESFKSFLKSIFYDENYCFLFIGYGVDEMEIIDFMIEKYSEGPKPLKNMINHFYILLPFFQSEEKLLRFEEAYFQTIAMSVIPYSIDLKGYDQLNDVIRSWREGLSGQNKDNDFYRKSQLIESNL